MGKDEGSTRKTTDWLGNNPKQEHFDVKGDKVGETKFATDLIGNNPRQEHFDSKGNKVGETKFATDWLGNNPRKTHKGEYFKTGVKSSGEDSKVGESYSGSYPDSGSYSYPATNAERSFPAWAKWVIGLTFLGLWVAVSVPQFLPKNTPSKTVPSPTPSLQITLKENPKPNEWSFTILDLSHSSNNGRTWENLLSTKGVPYPFLRPMGLVRIYDRQNIDVIPSGTAGINVVIATRDGGKTWLICTIDVFERKIKRILAKTFDRGETWYEVKGN